MDRRVFRDRANPWETLSPLEVREQYLLFPGNYSVSSEYAEYGEGYSTANFNSSGIAFSCDWNTSHCDCDGLHGITRSSVCRAVKCVDI
ncbi:hypothetical protein DPMN_049165 [Dreissena polymorpha]|uniref:Uncharacterized protein n=1 Tax=Dreissena polymorpha TaxID=45954 RepID=A0A9D4DCU1_DREPO|nr:hypothetical protein DPMN_049165 [Dreissena polymorpha]